MKELILGNQNLVWGMTGMVFLLVSFFRKSYFPILSVILFYLALSYKTFVGEGIIADFIQNLLYISVGISWVIGYSFTMTGLQSRYLAPRDELRLIIYGVFFAIPSVLFFVIEISPDNALSYILFAGTFSLVMFLFAGKVDRLLKSNEEGYLEDTKNRIQETRLLNFKLVFGDAGILGMREQLEKSFNEGNLTKADYHKGLMEIHFLYQDYEGAISHAKEYMDIRRGNEGKQIELSSSYLQAMAEEAMGNIDNALKHYRYIENESNGHFYYVTQKLEKLKNNQ